MNPAKVFEQALCREIRKADVGAGVVLRPYQSLRFDGSWNEKKDFQLPLVDIRFASEAVSSDQSTMSSACAVTVITQSDTDRDHTQISALYDAVHGVIHGIFSGFINGETSGRYADFVASVAELAPGLYHIGGVEMTDPAMPESAEGVNEISLGLTVHFTYKE